MAALYWFRNDLRIDDNLLLNKLVHDHQPVYFCFIIEPQWFASSVPFTNVIGAHRWTFLKQSVQTLADALKSKGFELLTLYGAPTKVIPALVDELNIETLACANQVGYHENQQLMAIKTERPQLHIQTGWLHTLFTKDLIDSLNAIEGSFSKFRNIIERQNIDFDALPCSSDWPVQDKKTAMPKGTQLNFSIPSHIDTKVTTQSCVEQTKYNRPIYGGSRWASLHLKDYFLSGAPEHYKQTRNDLHGLRRSTLFSPWLALGSLSPKQVWQAVTEYEKLNQANESTYWIKFELLWREYFQWLALAKGNRLFTFSGSTNTSPKTSYYPERFKKWCIGNTPYPLVNALMNQLNSTGYMSNRGRQIVASCFVNELQLDWRYGASYFETQLIDYDVASNWGNWQYIAGVGADPRGGRWFNIDKQCQYYDPDGEFTTQWQGEQSTAPLDSVDLVDWPVAESHVD